MKKIVIIGGGIAGLSCAHILSTKFKNKYQIEVYEKESTLGGKVQVFYENDLYYQEHSPRVFLNNYVNLQNIFNEIPYDENRTLLDMYSDELKNYLISDKCENTPLYITEIPSLIKNVNFFNLIIIGFFILQGLLSCDERLNNVFDNFKFSDLLFTKNTKYVFEFISYVLGENLDVLPLTKMIKTFEYELKDKLEGYPVKFKGTRTFKIPYSEVFEKWEDFLTKNNVSIFKGYELIDKKIINNTITEFLFKRENHYKNVKCDIGILGMNLTSLNNFFSNTNSNLKNNFKKLMKKSKSVQPGIQIYFDKKIEMKRYGYFLLDTDWKMIVAPIDNFWNKEQEIKSVWSINIANPELKSKRLNKTLLECSPEEIKEEVWYQIKSSCVKTFVRDRQLFEHIKPIKISLWKNLVFTNNKLDLENTQDDYFWNSIGTNKYRPDQKTDIKNLYLTGALTQTNFYSYWTEGAVNSAYKTINYITNQTINYYKHERPMIFLPFNIIDKFLYKLKLPNILLTSICLFLLYKLFKLFNIKI